MSDEGEDGRTRDQPTEDREAPESRPTKDRDRHTQNEPMDPERRRLGPR